MRKPLFAATLALLFAAGGAPAARALPGEEPAKPPVPAPTEPARAPTAKEKKVRRFLEVTGAGKLGKQVMDEMMASFRGMPGMEESFLRRFEERTRPDDLVDMIVPIYLKHYDEPELDAAIAFYESPMGRKILEKMPVIMREAMEAGQRWGSEMARKCMAELEAEGGFVRPNENAAIATLRNLTSCQAQVQTSGRIDTDEDGIGEYGTLLELTGGAGVRKASAPAKDAAPASSSFASQGRKISPAILSPAMGSVDPRGIVTRNGYCFRVFLPDAAPTAGFVHEVGPADSVGTSGGTATVGVDLSETTWCAYAWPAERGKTGNRAFFVNQFGDVLQSSNDGAKWSGPDRAPPGNSAFRPGAGITGVIAVGTRGADGDVWKVTN